jgi:hypothetical protein
VTAAGERGAEPGAHDPLGQPWCDDHRPDDQHVAVVVGPGYLGQEQVVAQPGANPGNLVAGDRLAAAGAADYDAPVGVPGGYPVAEPVTQHRVVHGLLAVDAQVVDLVTLPGQPAGQVRLERHAVVVSGDRDPHRARSFPCRSRRGPGTVSCW